MCVMKSARAESREAARECSPGRKPCVKCRGCLAPKGRKKIIPSHQGLHETLISIRFTTDGHLAGRGIAPSRRIVRSDHVPATSKCDVGVRKAAFYAACREGSRANRPVLARRFFTTMKRSRRPELARPMHKTAPYKISSVDSAFARKLLNPGTRPRPRYAHKSF